MLDDYSPDQLDSEPRLCPTARHLCTGTQFKAVSKLLLDAGSGQLSG